MRISTAGSEPDGSVLGTDLDSGALVTLPYQTRDLGVTVLGQTGYGKTTLLEQLILQDIAHGTSVIVIDAHGDLTQRILSLAQVKDENLLLLEVWEDAPFRLNLFDCPDPSSAVAVDRTVSGIVQVFKRLFGSPREFYPRLERDLGNAARTVIANYGTMLDVPRLFWDAGFRHTALDHVTNQHVHEFWRLWERMGREDRRLEQLEATINRLDQFLSSELVAQLVGSTESTIPFTEVLDGGGRVLLLNLPVGEIGEGLTNLIGSLFLAVLTERIFARTRLAPGSRPRVHLYLDEYGRYATPTTAQLLTEGRKFGIGTTIAHQTRAQIPDAENQAAELQVGALICFQLIGADAQELSGEFHVAPEPQWEERVEEIEGTEPVLAICQTPVDHLLHTTHQDQVVRAVTQELLLPMQQALTGVDYQTAHPTWYADNDKQIKTGLGLINSLLVDAMEGRVPIDSLFIVAMKGNVRDNSTALRDRLTKILLQFQELWGLKWESDGYSPEELHEPFQDFVAMCLEPDSPYALSLSLGEIADPSEIGTMLRHSIPPSPFPFCVGLQNSRPTKAFRNVLIESWEYGVVRSTGERNPSATHPRMRHPLSSLNSHNWYSVENYRHVVKWCAAASVVSNAGKRGTAAQETVRFLVAAIVDRYNHDRALYAASHLPDYPVSAPQRVGDVPLQIHHYGRVYQRHTQSLRTPMDVPPEAIDRVAEIAMHAVPDRWDLVTYKEREVYDPLIYACYGEWIVKVAEWTTAKSDASSLLLY